MLGVMSHTLTAALPELLTYQLFIETCGVCFGGVVQLLNNDLYSFGAYSLPHLAKSHPECQRKKKND